MRRASGTVRGTMALLLALAGGCGDDSSDGEIDAGRPDGAVAMDGAAGDGAIGSDASTTGEDGEVRGDAATAEVTLPPVDAPFDYQLGGAYQPPEGVRIVSRDRNAAPAAGLYNLCYVNGFQIQPDEEAFWMNEHPDLILRNASGDPVIDPDWEEMLIDIRTPEKRAAVAEIVGGWIDGCADAGFDAIEIDNLDTYSRSNDLISEEHAVAFMRMLSDRAHARGLAIAQKNSAEILARREEMATDFAVAEECNRYDECGDYTAVYGDHVLVIEYRRQDFDAGCRDFPGLSIVLRDLELVTPAQTPPYVYDGC